MRPPSFVIEHAEREIRFLLTEGSLDVVGIVHAGDVPAVEVERGDVTCDGGGGGQDVGVFK